MTEKKDHLSLWGEQEPKKPEPVLDATVWEVERCGKEIRCWDYMLRPCLRDKGHLDGCNPFSNSYPKEANNEIQKTTGAARNNSSGAAKMPTHNNS